MNETGSSRHGGLPFFMPCHSKGLGVKCLNVRLLKPTAARWMHCTNLILNTNRGLLEYYKRELVKNEKNT